MKETALVKSIIEYLNLRNDCIAWRSNTGALKNSYTDKLGILRKRFVQFGFAGMADILGMTSKGIFLAVEAKIGKNKQSEAQIAFQHLVEKNNGIYILAYSIDDVKRGLERNDLV